MNGGLLIWYLGILLQIFAECFFLWQAHFEDRVGSEDEEAGGTQAFKRHRLVSCRCQGMSPLKTKISGSNSFSMEGPRVGRSKMCHFSILILLNESHF